MKTQMTTLRDALNEHPTNASLLNAQAQMFRQAGHYAVAYHIYCAGVMSAVDEQPDMVREAGATALLLAGLSKNESYIETGRDLIDRAALLERRDGGSESAETLFAQGACRLIEGDPVAAEDLLRRALALKENPAMYPDLGHALLMQGKWGEGFATIEKALDIGERRVPKHPDVPYWDGEATEHLLVIGEQGLGDELSHYSMLPDLLAANVCNHLTVRCEPRLVKLLQRNFPGVTFEPNHGVQPAGLTIVGDVVTVGPEITAKVLSGSLAVHFRKEERDFPRRGFLTADPWRVGHFISILEATPGKKVGIAYTGGTPGTLGYRRTLPRDELMRMLREPGVCWVSLQYTPQPEHDIQWIREHGGTLLVPDLDPADYGDVAALVTALDDVVTVPTAVAHLCGALGRKAHVIANKAPRWFYGTAGRRHAWYDALIVHRQARDGTWPIGEVLAEIRP